MNRQSTRTGAAATFLSTDTGRWLVVAALYAGLTAAYCWPVIQSLGSGLPNDTGDPGLISFVLWWNAQAVPFTERWWNAPMFYPQTGALAFSETALGMSLFSSPLIWAGASAIQAYNVLFIGSVFTAALSSHALARHLTGRHDAALIAGLAFGFSPYRAAALPHLQLLVTCWMALGLLAAHRYLRDRRPADLVLFAVCWLMSALTSGYYLLFFSVLVGLWMLWFVRERRDWLAMAGALMAAAPPIAAVVFVQKQILGTFDMTRVPGEIEAFSADVSSFLSASSQAWLPSHWTLAARHEGELYPGLVIVGLTMIAGVMLWRRLDRPTPMPARRWFTGLAVTTFVLAAIQNGRYFKIPGLAFAQTHLIVTVGIWSSVLAILCDRRLFDLWRRRSTFAFYVLAAIVTAVLCLGPVGRVFDVRFLNLAPYSWLMALPGGDALRVPARFAMLMTLCLAQAGALAFVRLSPAGARVVVVVLTALLVLADGWVIRMPVAPVEAAFMLPRADPGSVVLEVPVRDQWNETAALLRATVHGLPIVNGYSGYKPPYYDTLLEGLHERDPSIIETFRHLAPLVVFVNRGNDLDGTYDTFVSQIPDAQFMFRVPKGSLYQFPAAHPSERSQEDDVLAIERITTTAHGTSVSDILDGTVETPWSTIRPQQVGDQIRIDFNREAIVSRIEMDLGQTPTDFPRRLRIDAFTGEADGATVWHSGTAGPTVLAMLHGGPLAIDLPAGTRASALTLTLTAGHPRLPWSIAELRTFGHLAVPMR